MEKWGRWLARWSSRWTKFAENDNLNDSTFNIRQRVAIVGEEIIDGQSIVPDN
jgi:hypothetical protein